jgi:ectoine hydroxylase-related dioxygenase (phytanoyl-CoA dioxygenase family)
MRDLDVVPRLAADASVDQVEAQLRDAGCVIVEALAPPDLLDRITAELEPHLAATPPGGDDFAGRNTRRTGALIARSPAFRELAAHPLVLGALDRVLADHATSYQLHLTQVIEIGPAEPAQPVHRDQWAFDFFAFPPGFEVECHTMWALSDFTDENGATRVIPGSHRWADRLRPEVTETIAAEMSRGSVLLYVGSLYHGGGANSSAAPRRGINVGYTLSWLRQEENQYLACPPEVARELPPELARLVGYQRGAYALGYFGDLRDPMEAVHGFDDRPPRFAAES